MKFKGFLNKMNHVFTHGDSHKHTRVTRNPGSFHSKKKSSSAPKKDFPLIRSFKPQDCVPLKIRGELQHYAKETTNGAIQVIKQPHVSVKSYPVIVMTEHDLEQAHFQRTDSANFSSSLTHRFVEPATFHEDIMSGRLAVIPSHKTIKTLATFDAMNHIRFHWGLISDALTSNKPMSSAKVDMLSNTVGLSDLIDYDKHPKPMYLNSDRELIVGKKPEGSKQAGQQPVTPQSPDISQGVRNEGPRTPQQPDQGGAQQVRFNTTGQGVPDSDNDVPHLHDDGSSRQAPQSSTPRSSVPRQPSQPSQNQQAPSQDQTSSTSSDNQSGGLKIPNLASSQESAPQQPSNSGNDTPNGVDLDPRQQTQSVNGQNEQQPSNQQNSPQDQQDSPVPPDNAEESPRDINNTEPNQPTESDAEANAQEDPDLAQAEQALQNDNSTSRVQQHHEDDQPAETPDEASKRMQSFVQKAFYDPDLGIKLDLSDLEKVLKKDQPFQFKIRPVDPKDPKAHLDAKINKRLAQMNFGLRQLHHKHMQGIMNDSLTHLKDDADHISDILDPHRKNSAVHNRYKKINQDYQMDKRAERETSAQMQKENQRQYDRKRNDYINVQTDRAKADFDQRHQGPFNAQQRRIAEYSDGSAENKRTRRRSELKDWRTRLAKRALNNSVEQLSRRAQNLLEDSNAKERAQYFTDKHQINQMDGAYYKKEIQRARDVSYSKRHDHKIADLKQRARENSHKWQTRLSELQASDRNDRLNILRSKKDSTAALMRNNSNLRQRLLDAIDFAHKAGNKIPPKYAQSLKLKDIRYHNLEKTHNEEIQSLYQRIKRLKNNYNASWDASQKRRAKEERLDAENRNSMLQSLSYQQSDKDHKWREVIISVCAASILCIIGAAVIGHSIGHSAARTHYVKHYVVEGSRGNGGGGTHTTINNSTPTTNKPESHASNAAPASHNSHQVGRIDRSLMTKRPPRKSGLYIGTSTAHRPTSYMYVKRIGFYHKGMFVTGKKNNSLVKLKVTRAFGDRIFVKDLTNNAYYEFNTY